MSAMDDKNEMAWRQRFKRLNRFMLLMWRLGFGKWVNSMPRWTGRIMVLVHRGRKSGARRYTPVNYAQIDGDLYCTAGFGSAADWYKNILADADVDVWLPDGWWAGVAEDTTKSLQRLTYLREVLRNSGLAAPMFGVNPAVMDDEELTAATSDYQLVRIKRTQARTGPGGPGDLAWVWPAATFFLFMVLLRRKRK